MLGRPARRLLACAPLELEWLYQGTLRQREREQDAQALLLAALVRAGGGKAPSIESTLGRRVGESTLPLFRPPRRPPRRPGWQAEG